MKKGPWTILHSQVRYEDNFVKLTIDEVIKPVARREITPLLICGQGFAYCP
ncbi:hypothetical protein BH23BAC1_BH23BAC1_42340 [soil metagenome]